MIPTLSIFHNDPSILLVADIPGRWREAHDRNDLRTWRALGVYLFNCAMLLSREGLQWIAEDHDTLASVAMRRAYDLAPLARRSARGYKQLLCSTNQRNRRKPMRVYQLTYLSKAAVLAAEMEGMDPKPTKLWFPSEREAVVRRLALVNAGALVGKKADHEIWPVDIPTDKQGLLLWLNRECV